MVRSLLAGLLLTILGFGCAAPKSGGGWSISRLVDVPLNARHIEIANAAQVHQGPASIRFSRLISDSAFDGDAPGSSIRFSTDATDVKLLVHYPDMDMSGARPFYLSKGVCVIDGVKRIGIDRRQEKAEDVEISLADDEEPRQRYFEIFLPISDTVEVVGLRMNSEARLFALEARPKQIRYVAFGDSITQGYFAGDPTRTYPSIIGEEFNWETLNMGFSGRQIVPHDARAVARLNPDVVSIMIGVNDYLHKVSVEEVARRFENWLEEFRLAKPDVPVVIVTPLPVPGGHWRAAGLEAYRDRIKEVVQARNEAHTVVVDGKSILPKRANYFKDGLHPNGTGFSYIAHNLSLYLEPLVNKK